MRAIYKQELKPYFYSMTDYVFIIFMTMFMGTYFMIHNTVNDYPYFSHALNPILMILMIVVPILTMRGMLSEHRARADQLLLTSPVSIWGIVMGKLLSMVTIFAIPMAIACPRPFIVQSVGTAYLAEDYVSILTFFLLECVYIAIGLSIFSLVENQLIIAVGTFGILLLSVLWSGLLNFVPTTATGSLAGFLILWTLVCFIVYRPTGHTPLSLGLEVTGAAVLIGIFLVKQSMSEWALTRLPGKIVLTGVFNGIVSSHMPDVGGPVYYLSTADMLLFLTIQSIEKRRWS